MIASWRHIWAKPVRNRVLCRQSWRYRNEIWCCNATIVGLYNSESPVLLQLAVTEIIVTKKLYKIVAQRSVCALRMRTKFCHRKSNVMYNHRAKFHIDTSNRFPENAIYVLFFRPWRVGARA